MRRRGHAEHQAQDLTQEFFARFLAANSLESVVPERGRFRTFLLAALKNFLANEWRDANRQKRGGGKELISLDEFAEEEGRHSEPSQAAEPDTVFDRRWAETVVASALSRLAGEMQGDEVQHRFNVLKVFLQGDGGGLSYADAARLAHLSEPAAKTTIFRMRRRYGELIRDEIGQTVDSPEDIEAEIRHLVTVLGAGCRRVDTNQGVTTIPAAELEQRFAALSASAPCLGAWPNDLPRWHLERAAVAESAKNWFTAVFHLKRLAALEPDDVRTRQRLETARAAMAGVPPAL